MSPTPERFGFLAPDGVIAFAHRGGNRAAPENTVASFQHAVDLGYRYLETDVQRTVDGVLVAFHDLSLRRIAGDERLIEDIEWAELAEISFEGHSVPRMDELFERFPDARFNLDPKTDAAVEPLAESIRRNAAIDRVCVGSFSDRRLDRLRHLLGPELCTSPGPRAIMSAFLPWPLPGDHPCVSLPHEVGSFGLNQRVVRRFQNQGYRVHVWTVNDEDDMHRMIDIGVDGIMTDECELLRTVLTARGLWH